jgi:HEAT repeat protein
MRSLISFILQAGLLWGGLTTADGAEQPNKPETLTAQAWHILTDGVNAKKFGDRMMALKALGDLGPNAKGVQLVAGMLKDDDPDIRAQAAATLGEIKSRTAIRPLRIALSDQAPQVSFAAAKSLWELGDATGKRVLLDVLQGEKPSNDGFAGHMRAMRRKLGDKKELAGMGATETAGALLPGPLGMGVGLAKKGLTGTTNLARADSATLLSRRPDRETLLALKAALVDHDWTVRASAAKAIGALGRPNTLKWLEFSLDDGKPAVRFEAAVSILRITSRAKTPTYAKLP